MIDLDELKRRIDVAKTNYYRNIDHTSWYRYYMIVSAYYEISMIEGRTANENMVYETLLGYVRDLKNNNFRLSDFEINKIMEMEHYLNKELEIKLLKWYIKVGDKNG